MVALGLSALDAKAKWSTLPDTSGGEDYQFRELAKSLKGNGWSIPAADGKTWILPAGAVASSESGGAANARPSRGLLGGLFGGGGSSKPAAPAAADLTKDVRALIAAFHKNDERSNSDFSSGFRGNENVLGRLLLLATQIYQTGNTALANELAIAVFDLTPSRERAINAAVSLIADHAYEAAAREFFTTYDWAAYHRVLAALVEKFPRGWMAHDAVAMLIPQLAKQAAGEPAPALSLPGIQLDPKALAAVEKLTAKPAADSSADDEKLLKRAGYELSSIPANQRARVLAYLRNQGMRSNGGSPWWLLEPADAKDSDNSPVARITALGIAALPVLAAMTDDPYFSFRPNETANEDSMYFSPNDDEEELTLRVHARLNRPATRGEVACNLLRQTLPDNTGELHQAGPEALRDLALAFWKDHQHATRDELAVVFLREGSTYQNQSAAKLLASSTDPKARQAFESYVLAADPAIAQFQSVQTYLTARKGAAKAFFEAYAKLVRSQGVDTGDNDGSNEYAYLIKQAGGAEKILKRLSGLVAGVSPRAMAKEIAKGKPGDAQAAIRSLLELMKDDTPVKRLYALLEGAIDSGNPLIRCQFLQATGQIAQREDGPDGQEERDEADDDKPASATERKLGEAEIKVWQQLLADTRDMPNNTGEKVTIGDLAAAQLLVSINPGLYQTIASAGPVLQKTETELFREHATARLDGKPPPPLPDASHVKPDRIKAIISEAGAKPATEIHPYLSTLTPDERAAWLAWARKPGEIAIPKSVKELSFLVTCRDQYGYGESTNVKGAGLIDIGFTLTPATLKSHIESLAKDPAKHSRTIVLLYPASFAPGLQVRAQVMPFPKETKEKPETKEKTETDSDDSESNDAPYHQISARSLFQGPMMELKNRESAAAVILVMLNGTRNDNHTAVWFVEKGKANPKTPEDSTALDTALQNYADSPEIPPFHLDIQVLTKADADKLEEPSSPEDPFRE